jgi:hypothetical protein
MPYSWCISKKESNMFYTYRYRENEPTFYFIKVKDRTKKELETFSGKFNDKYHFFVLQVVKGAKIGDTKTKQYVVTSASNDGDNQMSWDDIVNIEPRIANLQKIFKSVPIDPEDREFYDKYAYDEDRDSNDEEYVAGASDDEFCKFNYVYKKKYLDMIIPDFNIKLSDKQFKCLPDDLKNHFIGFGFGLTAGQFDLIKNNKNLLKRYKEMINRKYEEYLKGTRDTKFSYTELFFLPKEMIVKNDLRSVFNFNVEYFDSKAKEEREKINFFISELNDKENILKMNPTNLYTLQQQMSKFHLYNETKNLSNSILEIGGKDLLNEFINRPEFFYYFTFINQNYKNVEIFNYLIDKGGKGFLFKLLNNIRLDGYPNPKTPLEGILFRLSRFSGSEIQKNGIFEIIIKMLNIGGKEFVDKLNEKEINNLIWYSNNSPEVKQILQIKDNSTTPMNEIFNSLSSLQEELTEQRKETIKESNLMKFQNFIKKRKINQ